MEATAGTLQGGDGMNQKCCSTCENMRTSRIDGKRYCMAQDGKEIILRYAKKRPEWCPKLGKREVTE